jgi:hypothetical protein
MFSKGDHGLRKGTSTENHDLAVGFPRKDVRFLEAAN